MVQIHDHVELIGFGGLLAEDFLEKGGLFLFSNYL